MNNLNFHKPVLLNEMIENLSPKQGEIYLDATFGAGGYSRAILESADCKLYAIDRDDTAKKFADEVKEEFGDRFIFCEGKFSDAKEILNEKGVENLDGIIMDIGVSSMQLDDRKRGFSFDSEAKLDMRMDRSSGVSAYEVVNEKSEKELAQILKEFGEEPKARRIAKKIVEKRAQKPISSCQDLANIVRSQYAGYFKTDPATRSFQAIRIYVNQELEELKNLLDSSIDLLKKDGRLIAVSFHSLEDSIVKKFLKKQSGQDKTFSRYEPQNNDDKLSNFKIITKSAISPSKEELLINIRSRSSKMRVAIKN